MKVYCRHKIHQSQKKNRWKKRAKKKQTNKQTANKYFKKQEQNVQ